VDQLETYKEEALVLAGGTDLLVALKQRHRLPKYVLSLKGIPELSSIKQGEGRLFIGALTTLYALGREALVRQHLPALAEAAHLIGAVRLQTVATVGGNLCLDTRCKYYNQSDFWRRARPACCKMGGKRCLVTGRQDSCSATFAADLAPVMLVLGARVHLATPAGEQVSPLSDFYPADGDGREPNLLAKRVRGILTLVEVPLVPDKRAVYRKFRLRGAIDFPLVGVAAAVTGSPDRWQQGAMAITGVAPRPLVLAAGAPLLRPPRR
jgi:4-hydroxybenzoyl-CoA reductase subunit beta